MPNVRRLIILTDGQRIEIATNEVTILELASIAKALTEFADNAINQAATVKGKVLDDLLRQQQETKADPPAVVERPWKGSTP